MWVSCPDINFGLTFTSIVLSIGGAPSDERSGLSFVVVIIRPLCKTPPPILYCCMTSSPERTPKKTPTVALAIVACLSVAIATVVNTCRIAYSIQVTISKTMGCFQYSINIMSQLLSQIFGI
jgi:hypothetical protein